MEYHILKDNGPRPISQFTGPDWQLHDAGAGWGILFSTGPEWQLSDIGGGWQLHDGGPGWCPMLADDGDRIAPFSVEGGPGWDSVKLDDGPGWNLDGGERPSPTLLLH